MEIALLLGNKLNLVFHSISFPSEWESYRNLLHQPRQRVSIQLVSLLARDTIYRDYPVSDPKVFPFN
jgi:hypothetical protein